MQPPFGKWLPIALMIGVLAGISVWLTTGWLAVNVAPWLGAVWVVFISWGLYFAGGAKLSRFHKYFFGLTGGIVLGWLTLLVYGWIKAYLGDPLALPVTVFLAATSIVLLELTDWFEYAPAYFLSYAGYFAFVFGNFAPGATPEMATIYFWVLILIGLAFGFVSASVKEKMFDWMGVPKSQRQTVFDKENRSMYGLMQ
ncbi:MAG: DUF1097 domain-containing protein [Candidatus Niyogibacteria bacterium]|nr:DUF1097 domain-containing protein [Candidatus Niyogibacteria bacterium]